MEGEVGGAGGRGHCGLYSIRADGEETRSGWEERPEGESDFKGNQKARQSTRDKVQM